jgi:hypothetical protein
VCECAQQPYTVIYKVNWILLHDSKWGHLIWNKFQKILIRQIFCSNKVCWMCPSRSRVVEVGLFVVNICGEDFVPWILSSFSICIWTCIRYGVKWYLAWLLWPKVFSAPGWFFNLCHGVACILAWKISS